MITETRSPRPGISPLDDTAELSDNGASSSLPTTSLPTPELARVLAEVKGQAQFLLYLTDQIEQSIRQFSQSSDAGHNAFLCKVLSMYSAQLESKHQALGDRITEACQEVYVTVREFDVN